MIEVSEGVLELSNSMCFLSNPYSEAKCFICSINWSKDIQLFPLWKLELSFQFFSLRYFFQRMYWESQTVFIFCTIQNAEAFVYRIPNWILILIRYGTIGTLTFTANICHDNNEKSSKAILQISANERSLALGSRSEVTLGGMKPKSKSLRRNCLNGEVRDSFWQEADHDLTGCFGRI